MSASMSSGELLDVDNGLYSEAGQQGFGSDVGDPLAKFTEGVIIKRTASAEERAKRIREKNRRAQARFREKAKVRDGQLEQQAAELANELERVLLEKKALELEMQAMARQKEQQEALLTERKDPPYVPSEGFSEYSPLRRGGLLLRVACNPPRKLTHKQVMQLSLSDRLLINQEMVTMARQLLALCPDRNPQSDAGKQLVALMQEKHGMLAYLAGHNALLMHRLQFSDEDGRQGIPKPTAQFWDTIQRRMGLSEEQKRYLNEARCRLLYNTEELMRERARLQDTLKGIEVHYQGTFREAGRFHVQWAQISQALRDNIDKEHVLQCRFYACIWLAPHGITPFQEAQMMVDSHPHYPDMLAIFESLEAELSRQPVLLDADDTDVEGLNPRNGELPDPTVEQYKPLELKLMQSIFSTKLFITAPGLKQGNA